ncbi:MAG: AraC family ligand binding domain-containing protein [Oscillospiraceae bacterium]
MEEQLDWHYHTFHKLIFFLGGQSGYGVEGRSYPLEPGDVILVPQGSSTGRRPRPARRTSASFSICRLTISPAQARRSARSTAASRSPRPASASFCARRRDGRPCAARSSHWRVPPCSRASGRSCWQSPF